MPVKRSWAGHEILWALAGGTAAFIYSASGRFIIGGDTAQYVHSSFLRPPLYSLFLEFLGGIGCTWQAAVVLQSFFVAACALLLSLILRRRFNLVPWAFLAAYFLLLVPLLPSKIVYFSMWGLIGRYIMTEAAAYGILLLTYGLMVESVYEPSFKNVSLFAALAVLNTLVRVQLQFVYAAVPVFGLWFYLEFRDGRRLALLTAAFAACLLAGKAAGALCAGNHPAGSATGSHLKSSLFCNILFFSGPEDLALFAGRPDYPLLEKIYQDINAKKHFARFHGEMNESLGAFHDSRLVLIDEDARRIIQNEIQAPAQYDDRTSAAWAAMADGMVPVLLRKYWKDYLLLSAHEFIAGFTFRHGLAVGFFTVCWLWGLRRPPDIIALLTAVMAAANHAVVAVLMYNGSRHLFYTDTFALLFVVLLLGCRDSSRVYRGPGTC